MLPRPARFQSVPRVYCFGFKLCPLEPQVATVVALFGITVTWVSRWLPVELRLTKISNEMDFYEMDFYEMDFYEMFLRNECERAQPSRTCL
jgi:hypothetical protein